MTQRTYPEFEKKILMKMLKTITDIFEEEKIIYSICAGTLLGAHRSGKFIKHDYDVDLCMHKESLPKFETAVKRMYKAGYGINLKEWESTNCFKFAPIDYKQNPNCFIPTIDVYTIVRYSDGVWRSTSQHCIDLYPTWIFPERMYFPLKKIKFEDMWLFAPKNPKKLLRKYYGKKFMTPDNKYGTPNNEVGSGLSM